jgi:hypothetical protein
MLMDWIGTSFCEVAIDEERSDVSGRMDDKRGMATCYPEYFVTALVQRLQEGLNNNSNVKQKPLNTTPS